MVGWAPMFVGVGRSLVGLRIAREWQRPLTVCNNLRGAPMGSLLVLLVNARWVERGARPSDRNHTDAKEAPGGDRRTNRSWRRAIRTGDKAVVGWTPMLVGAVRSKVGLRSARETQWSLNNEINLRRAPMGGHLALLFAARRLERGARPSYRNPLRSARQANDERRSHCSWPAGCKLLQGYLLLPSVAGVLRQDAGMSSSCCSLFRAMSLCNKRETSLNSSVVTAVVPMTSFNLARSSSTVPWHWRARAARVI